MGMSEHDIAKAEVVASVYSVLFSNDAVSCVSFDFYQYIRKQSIYKFGLKHEVLRLEKERLAYEDRLNDIVKDANVFLADVSDVMQEIVSKDILKLEITTSNYLKKHGVVKSDIIAKAEVMRMIAGFSCINVSRQCDFLKSLKIKLGKEGYFQPKQLYAGLMLGNMFKFCDNITDILNKDERVNVDLNDSTDIKNGFNIIQKKLSDVNTIAFAINTAQNIEDGVVNSVEEQINKEKESDFDSKIMDLKQHFNCRV